MERVRAGVKSKGKGKEGRSMVKNTLIRSVKIISICSWNVKKTGLVFCGGGRMGLPRLLLLRMGSPNCEGVLR